MLTPGDMVLLYSEKNRYIITLKEGLIKFPAGALDGGTLIGKKYGERVEMPDGSAYWLLRPTPRDIIMSIKRKAQIIRPKDAAIMTFYSGLKSGDVAVEAGVGSGGLTSAILNTIGPDGILVSIDKNPEFIGIAEKNIRPLFPDHRWEVFEGDVCSSIIEPADVEIEGANVFFLDLPTPWDAYGTVDSILWPGGTLVIYVPTYNQLEKSWNELDGYVDIFALEITDRGIEKVSYEGGTALRPSNTKVGFTAFLLFARKVL